MYQPIVEDISGDESTQCIQHDQVPDENLQLKLFMTDKCIVVNG